MPEFSSPFEGNVPDRKLTAGELVRAIRFSIAAEYEAIQLYTQLAEAVDNKKARAVLMDIANEEREHAGEFLALLDQLEPDEKKYYDRGAGEVEEILKKL